jgi:chaperonin GroEL (HSP60 family)
MDWNLAIKRYSKALKAIIEALFTLLGLDGADAVSRIPRSLHSAVLAVLCGPLNPPSAA